MAVDPPVSDENDAAEQAATDVPEDELKRRFREALERKQAVHADRNANSARDGSKINGVHSRAGGKRAFRRKSG